MATTRQKEAARQNIEKAREVQSARAHGAKIPKETAGLSTAAKDKLPDKEFAFPKERKEPLTDAKRVRSAISRFDQVEGVSDAERDKAWKRILKAAKRYDVEVSEASWRELGKSSKKASSPKKSSSTTKASSPKKAGSTRKASAKK
ncbi:MAG: DUF6582 domain-containing protein [Streptosporangiaceae bacterium]